MIAVSAESGTLIKAIPEVNGEVFGFHRLFGLISENAFHDRVKHRKLRGLSLPNDNQWLCRFMLFPGFDIQTIEGCEATKVSDQFWKLQTTNGLYYFTQAAPLDPLRLDITSTKRDRTLIVSILISTLLLMSLFLFPSKTPDIQAPEEIEPIAVKIKLETQRPVFVPAPTLNAIPSEVTKNQQVRRAVQQDLGFLGLLGKKDLNKILGGAPSTLKDASPGAGAGGKGGSGGESLVGLGQGLKRTTVGNSGVKGLGGIGTKGAGGGAGGYGSTMIGSGEGKALSSIPVSQDIVLEGGLDRAVIQATIAKYISQIRACYEQGLSKNPGLNGQVTMQFEVGVSGNLNYAKVARSSLGNAEVEQCISRRMMDWKFPKPLGGVNVKVSYPFLLRPVGS